MAGDGGCEWSQGTGGNRVPTSQGEGGKPDNVRGRQAGARWLQVSSRGGLFRVGGGPDAGWVPAAGGFNVSAG
jgi:hypothetical protein